MEKQKRWQLVLILAVLALTLYNILPTIFYYSKPLSEPIQKRQAAEVALDIANRVNQVQQESIAWTKALIKHLGVKGKLEEKEANVVVATFPNAKEATFFRKTLPRASALQPFVPAQVELVSGAKSADNEVLLERRLFLQLDKKHLESFFTFVEKREGGKATPAYQNIVFDRLEPFLLPIMGQSQAAQVVEAVGEKKEGVNQENFILQLASQVVAFDKAFGSSNPIAHRYFASFTQGATPQAFDSFVKAVAGLSTAKEQKIAQLTQAHEGEKLRLGATTGEDGVSIRTIEREKALLDQALGIFTKEEAAFKKGSQPLSPVAIMALLEDSFTKSDLAGIQTIDLQGRDPFIQSILVDWNNDRVTLVLDPQVQQLRQETRLNETAFLKAEQVNQLLVDEIARLGRLSSEMLTPQNNNFGFSLNQLTNSHSLLVLNLAQVASQEIKEINTRLSLMWHPENQDLESASFPVMVQEDFFQKEAPQRALGLWIMSPALTKEPLDPAFRNQSLYIVGRGLQALLDRYQQEPTTEEAKTFFADFKALEQTLEEIGFFGYAAQSYNFSDAYAKDYIFELPNYYTTLLDATREKFTVHGSRRYATLEFTDVEQRILAQNQIDDQIHEDLLKWRDLYQTAQVNLNPQVRLEIPPPIQNVYWQNFLLNIKKYFRGDNRKTLKWGLDLSGGKSVRLGLKDKSGRLISNPDDLKQAVDELYRRVNKLGVSDVGIRLQDQYIVLDFPGSQGLSAAELVQAAAMSFHITNEKFSPLNKDLASATNEFLQQVWNEAVVTSRTDPASVHEIAFRMMGGSDNPLQEPIPQSDAAAFLYENGLRLANFNVDPQSGVFDDSLSMVVRLRSDDFSQWQNQTHPLMVVFYNYALEGANLEDIRVGYDPSKGNMLSFGVRASGTANDGQTVNFRDQFYSWTSQFAQEKIAGTPREKESAGHGWRMSVLLNGTVISAPTLNAPLRDHAMITGHFSQREINELAADLKAGALSFVPSILSEENISPELGRSERFHGMLAAAVGTLLVIVLMVSYYRFAGVVASVAVLFNLLIMWGVLQNIDAALTLPGIAGVILTIGMAVDANVLVFERIREEFAHSKRLPAAVQAGYRKAFSAIIDSNLTTIIAALILMQFDSGPVKGFAVTLIVGIITSMFTSLFMTRYFFAGWVRNPEHKSLKMSQWITKPRFSFMNKKRVTVLVSAIIVAFGLLALAVKGEQLVGMDFTGGFAITLDLQETQEANYRDKAAAAFIKGGAGVKDFQIRALGSPNQLRVQFSKLMQEPGHPFALLAQEEAVEGEYAYERNPRIVWVINSLAQEGLSPKAYQLAQLDQNWSVVSGQFSDAMRNQALLGLGLAMLAILVYITVRFEFKYAISALLGICYDLVITLALFGLLNLLGLSVQIDLNVIAALMTIIGYSLNDTIIIFDRIREDIRLKRKVEFKTLINHALNATLSRTIMTSATTLVVLLALLFLGGRSILDFSLVMALGVIVGTLSSLFVAAPLLYYFHKKEEEREQSSVKRVAAVKH